MGRRKIQPSQQPYSTTFAHRRKVSRSALWQFSMTAADDLNMAIDALKERLKGVLEVIVMTSRKYLIDIFIGWPEDKYHGHIVITTRKEIKIIHNRAYGCRGYSCP